MRAEESYDTAMVAIDGFQNQEVNIILEQIYKMIDESAKNGLFNLYIDLIKDDFIFRFDERTQVLLRNNNDFCQLIKQRLLQDGYRAELWDYSGYMKQLKIYWDKQAIEQPKEKKKKWFWQKG